MTASAPRIFFLTALTLVFFAANSLLARAALRQGEIDAATFTAARLLAGALTLAFVAAVRGTAPWRQGSNRAALSLVLYAIAFSLAYQLLDAGTGALLLFATVQITMLSSSILAGHHPGSREWTGIALAFAGLLYLVFPGLTAPSPLGVMLMTIAGVCWALYTLAGRSFASAADATCGNFVRAAPLAVLLLLVWAVPVLKTHASPMGLALAAVSGAVTSGLGYILWYSVLRSLSTTRAAIVQLTVPVIAALAGVLVLGERFTWRLGVSAVTILGGVAVALTAKERSR